MRLFVADADSTFRLAVQMYLQQEPGLYFTGMAAESQGLSVQLRASRPDLLLLDWHLPGASAQDLLLEILDLEYPPEVLIVSDKYEDKELALSAGASGFVSKSGFPDELVKEIRLLQKRKGNLPRNSSG